MRSRIVYVVAACVLAAVAADWLHAQAPTGGGELAPSDAQIAQWVRNLDDEDYALRADAARGLVGVEGRALPALKQALKAPVSLEFRRRADAILRQLAIFEPGGPVVDGLKVRLVLDREEARPGESVRFVAALANMTSQPMNLEVGYTTCGNYFQCGSALRLRDSKGNDVPAKWSVGFCGTGAKAILATIPPRSVVEFQLPANLAAKDGKLVLALGANKFCVQVLDEARPSRFRIVFQNEKASRGGPPGGKYTPVAPAIPDARYWTGTAYSNEVVLNVKQ